MTYHIVAKMLYVTVYPIQGSFTAFMPLLYSQVLHMNYHQIGFLLAVTPFVQMVACPFWIQAVDRYPKWHGSLMGMLTMIGGLSIFIICFLPEWITISDSSQSLVMMIVFICCFVFAFTTSPLPTLVDSIVVKVVDNHFVFYGNQRVLGTISTIFHILMIGVTVSMYNLQVAFGIFFVELVLFVSLSVAVHMIITSKETHDDESTLLSNNLPSYHLITQPNTSRATGSFPGTALRIAFNIQTKANEALHISGVLPSLGLLLSSVPTTNLSLCAIGALYRKSNWPEKRILMSMLVYTFMISTFLYSLAHAMINQFLFLLLTDLGINPLLLGINLLMIMVYLAFFFHAVIYTCLSAYDTRTTSIVFMLQILNDFAYAMTWAIAMTEIDSFFPIDQQLVAKGIFAVLFCGLGCAIGCLSGGLVYGSYGSIKLFQIAAFTGSVSLIVFLTGRRPAP
ncbi:major facilitator superfamily domain-containing protein [Blakeslea trispora]|nr:major facilitator superfamily domain-containing protein [Blakeslea trispora]